MNKKLKTISIGSLMLLWMAEFVSAVADVTLQLCTVLDNVYTILFMIAGAVGVIVIVMQGIKWAASADDPGARKQAKEGVIHAIVGLIIVFLAIVIVGMVFGAAAMCALARP